MYQDEYHNMRDYVYQRSEDGTYRYGPTRTDSPYRPVEPAGKKKRTGLKMAALALCCVLLGGMGGFLGGRLAAQEPVGGTTAIEMSNRVVEEVKMIPVDGQQELTMSQVYAANVNHVVSINTSTEGYNVFGQRVDSASSGSGFVITADGFIVTNYHVVKGASAVTVTLFDGTEYPAVIVGGDEDYDVAVIKVEATDLSAVVLGDSDSVYVGDSIAAIGNPLGELTFSMSTGAVSCVNRAINVDGTPFNTIQIDASINPGNSGGPLFNNHGEVIGIVSAKYSSYGSTMVEGVGFAIPINDVVAMIQDIMTNGFVTNKPYLAITGGTVNAAMAQQEGMTQGVYVYSLEKDGAAERAGLQIGDIITAIDGKAITSLEDLNAAKKTYSAGDTATFTLYRQGESREVALTFDSAPLDDMQEPQAQYPQAPRQEQRDNNYYDYWNSIFGEIFGRGGY